MRAIYLLDFYRVVTVEETHQHIFNGLRETGFSLVSETYRDILIQSLITEYHFILIIRCA